MDTLLSSAHTYEHNVRLKAGLTQVELAEKIGTKKSFISRVEKGRADIQLSTLVKVFRGVGRESSVRVL